MHFHQLLQQRAQLQRQTRLANLAYAYERLADYARRVERAGLRGPARLQSADPADDRFWPVLTAEHAAASALEEHFLEEDVLELEEIFQFLRAEGFAVEPEFDFADLRRRLLPVLHRELQRGGVRLPPWNSRASGAAAESSDRP